MPSAAVVAERVERTLQVLYRIALYHGLCDGKHHLLVIAVLIVDELACHKPPVGPGSFTELCHDDAEAYSPCFHDKRLAVQKSANPAHMAHASVGVPVKHRFAELIASVHLVQCALVAAPCDIAVVGVHVRTDVNIEQPLAVAGSDLAEHPAFGRISVALARPALFAVIALESLLQKLPGHDVAGRPEQVFPRLRAAFLDIKGQLRALRNAFALAV